MKLEFYFYMITIQRRNSYCHNSESSILSDIIINLSMRLLFLNILTYYVYKELTNSFMKRYLTMRGTVV